MDVTATAPGPAVVVAALSNGASLQAHFSGGTPPSLAALTPMLSLAAGATITWTTQAIALSNAAPAANQTVVWQSNANMRPVGPPTAVSDKNGIATKSLTVGPLTPGQQVSASACLNGTNQCVSFVALGARPEYAYLEAISGTVQDLAASSTPDLINLRVRDMNGNPMAGGTVTFYQAVYEWAPPCPPRGRCPDSELLATQTSTATSALDGSVNFAPASIPGVATSVVGLAVTGNSGSLSVAIEQQP
jgi:hypothetical protein